MFRRLPLLQEGGEFIGTNDFFVAHLFVYEEYALSSQSHTFLVHRVRNCYCQDRALLHPSSE